jgi:membrane-associated phospholipid phosphatase
VLHQLDVAILQTFNRAVGLSPTFDRTLGVVTEWSFVRAAVLVALVWWGWIAGRDSLSRSRILAGLAGVALATGLSKLIQMSVFVHQRPFHHLDDLRLTLPRGVLTNWGYSSSFPSDTATLYFALAMVIFGMSRKAGVFAILWVAVLIALPRIYLTFHFPSDILAGAVLGIGTVWALQCFSLSWPIWRKTLWFEARSPQFFYPVMFCYLYQVVDAFQFFDLSLAYLKPH